MRNMNSAIWERVTRLLGPKVVGLLFTPTVMLFAFSQQVADNNSASGEAPRSVKSHGVDTAGRPIKR